MSDDDDCASSSGGEEADCYVSDQEDDIADALVQGLDDGRMEEGQWSVSSVITKGSLLAAQKQDLRKVMELLALEEQHARTLLMHYRWDVERIFELLDQKGREQLFLEAGVKVLEDKGLASSSSSSTVICNVCFENVPLNAVTIMDCSHCYCNDCWMEHFIVKINDGKSRHIRCMAPKCNVVCDEAFVRNLVSARLPDIANRFDRFLLESYIEDNDKVKWCPSIPHCGNAIRVDGDVYCEVECTCGWQFCFNCVSEAHSPCSCLMWEHWTKKLQESESVNWIRVNTKPCPRCRKPVEKNGGCNLVACVCGQLFCWLCGGASSGDRIIHHSCGRFKEEQAKQSENARRDLYRYIHYHNRYKAHTDSLIQERKLKETIQSKISMLENKQTKIKDYSWAINGLNRLFRSRRILSYSYPFAFYMFGDELFKDEMTPYERELKQNLFEDQQQQIESNVEKLSMFLEKDFQDFLDDELMYTIGQVVNLSKVVDRLCKHMYTYIENDLLYPLLHASHHIAPYKSVGLEKASELSFSWGSDQSLTGMKISQDNISVQSDSTLDGNGTLLARGSSSSDESGCSSRKRARIDVTGSAAPFDLNMPSEVIDNS